MVPSWRSSRTIRARGVAGSTSRIGSVTTGDKLSQDDVPSRARLRCSGSFDAAPWRSRGPGAGGARRMGPVQREIRRVVGRGLALVAGATGIALIWTGLVGARPDWVE